MRLVAWNCCMALHRKVDALMALAPDVAVISECAEPHRIAEKAPEFTPDTSLWIGDYVHKGLGPCLPGVAATSGSKTAT